MNFVKKISGLFIACSLVLPCTAFAESNYTPENDYIVIDASDILLFDTINNNSDITLFDAPAPITPEETELFKYIIGEYQRRSKEIDISGKYTITVDRFVELYSAYMGILLQEEHPELFYAYGYIKPGQHTLLGELKTIIPYYSMSDEDIDAAQDAINKELDNIKAQLNDSMTDLEKVLFVHDYIVSNYEYDTRVFSDDYDVYSHASRTLDTMVLQNTGVCQGYSYLFKYVMDDIGIECLNVLSTECAHMWNKVKVDGKWYNIDLTYDDSMPNMSTNISHDFFLVTDDEIRTLDSEDHRTWNEFLWDGQTSAVQSYTDSSAFSAIHDVIGPTAYSNGSFYCFDAENNICEAAVNENAVRPRYTPSAAYRWNAYGETSYYTSKFSAPALYRGEIYFNSPNEIYRYDPTENKAVSVYKYSAEHDISETYFYGITVKDGILCAEYTTNPNYGLEKYVAIDSVSPVPVQENFSCSSNIAIDEETGNVKVTVDIPEELEETSKVMIAKFNEYGILIGFEEFDTENGSAEFNPGNDCRRVKAFIWSGGNVPLSDITEVFVPAPPIE